MTNSFHRLKDGLATALLAMVALAFGVLHAGSTEAQEGRRSAFRPNFGRSPFQKNDRSNFLVLRAFNDAVGQRYKATARVLCENKQVALATVVANDGWLVTKNSELPVDRDIYCQLSNGDEELAIVVSREEELDIALLRVDRTDLEPVQWEAGQVPERGRWLATLDSKSAVAAIGVVSTGPQPVTTSRAVLGIELASNGEDGGALVKSVLEKTGADLAGLKRDDVIIGVDGLEVASREMLLQHLRGGKGGQAVMLEVSRGERSFKTEARLMDLTTELLDDTEMEVNGPISARATGFARIFMHDTVLEPNQCGGPVCNLDGKVVGVNIARAGRVTSYAIPADTVKPLVDNLIAQARLVSRPEQGQQPIR